MVTARSGALDADCPVSNLPCTDCGNGAQACPTTECQAGFCEVSYPGCSDHDPCGGKGCGWECQACQGTGCTASVTADCNKVGKCQPGPPNCGATRCLAQKDCGEPVECSRCENGGACATYVCRGELCQRTCTPSRRELQGIVRLSDAPRRTVRQVCRWDVRDSGVYWRHLPDGLRRKVR